MFPSFGRPGMAMDCGSVIDSFRVTLCTLVVPRIIPKQASLSPGCRDPRVVHPPLISVPSMQAYPSFVSSVALTWPSFRL